VSIDPQSPQEESPEATELTGSEEKEEKQSTSPEPAKKPDGPETESESGPLDAQEAALAAMGAMKFYKRGDLVEGSIVQVSDDSLIIDIGTKTEGIIPREEISVEPNPDMKEFNVGDKVNAVVISEDDEGTYKLSKRRADQKLVWEKVEESRKEGARLEATGFRAVKGGLLVNIGTIAFLPQSLIDIRRVDDLEPFVGKKLQVKVVEYDREAKPHPKIVVSRRAVIEEDLTRERDQIYDTLKSGAVVDGKVIKLTNYGAFIDVGGLQGLLHISEMSLGRIRHPSDVMKEGETIKVKILKIDKRKKRISLGRRDLLPNPWEVIGEKFKPGMVVEGSVVRTADFGAFIKLDDYFEGLAHISELVENKISHAKEVFSPGDKVNVLIMNIDRKNRRIKLSVRRAAEAQRKTEVDEFMKSQGDLGNMFGSQLQEALKESEMELPSHEEVKEDEKVESVEEDKTETPETVEESKAEEKVQAAPEPVEVKTEETPEPVETKTEETPEPEEEKAEEPVTPEPEVAKAEETPEPEEEKAEEPVAAEAEAETDQQPESEEVKAEPEATAEEPEKANPNDEASVEQDSLSPEMNGTPLE